MKSSELLSFTLKDGTSKVLIHKPNIAYIREGANTSIFDKGELTVSSIHLVNGDVLTVKGSLSEVQQLFENKEADPWA